MVPISHDDFVLFRLDDNKEYQVWDSSDTPLRPLPGMYFCDAWRINPSLTHSVVAMATRSEESSLEEVGSDDIGEVATKPSAPLAGADAVPDGDVYELNLATTKALRALDGPLREALGSPEDRRSMDLRPLEHIDALTVAMGTVRPK